MTTNWSKGSVNGRTSYVQAYPGTAVVMPGIDGGWTLNRDVLQDVDLENFPTLAEAMAAVNG